MIVITMLQRIRHHLIFLLIVLLPFHALLVTVGTKLLEGSGHPPHSLLALWKEVLMALIFLIAILELFQSDRKIITGLMRGERWKWMISPEKGLILGLLLLAGILQFTNFQFSIFNSQFVFGFKYLFVPLIFFAVLATLPWEENFPEKKLFPALLIVGGIISLYGIITFFLPQGFFTALGYSDAHSLYAPGSSLSAFQQVSGTGIRRIQSTFSGPNQMGLWLLIPWSIGLVGLLKERNTKIRKYEKTKMNSLFTYLRIYAFTYFFGLLFISLTGIALLLTFSRSAWIAAFVITIAAIGMSLRGKQRMNIIVALFSAVVLVGVVMMVAAPSLINRSISNRHHFERVREGITTMIEHPFGLGLGSAGPASNRTSDACMYFDENSDISWAKDRADLCLFVGDAQVQPLPTEKACHCPLLPENWYIQVGIELGVVGFALFVILVALLISRLFHYSIIPLFDAPLVMLPVALSFLGISIAALFLHAWEDSAVAYTVWGLVGIGYTRISNNRIME